MRKNKREEKIIVDLFCGGGGTSTGVVEACRAEGYEINLTAINHWDVAIATHTKNHPFARHIHSMINMVDMKALFPKKRIDLLVASPECTHHSNARGGKPKNEQRRASAWHILPWLQNLYVENVLIENVREFMDWGPLGADGHPLKSKKGETYKAFIAAIKSLGYRVEARVLNCADYGDPTTRKRLFIMAKRGNKKITWPVSTHTKAPNMDLLFPDDREKWKPARDIIDWTIPGKSIFTRKRPLAPATLKRIESGLRKFGGVNAEPFIIALRRHMEGQSVNEPLSTVTGSGSHHGIVETFIMPVHHGEKDKRTSSIEEPMKTITGFDAVGLVESVIVPLDHGSDKERQYSVDDPMRTITSADVWGLAQTFIVPQGKRNPPRDLDRPLDTLTTTSRGILLCTPYLVPHKSEAENQNPRTHSVEEPLYTVTGGSNGLLIQPLFVQLNGKSDSHSIDNPLCTITGERKTALVTPIIVRACHTDKDKGAWPVEQPIPTVTGKEQFGLVEMDYYTVDIRFRMLQWHELALAMSFPKEYEFAGNRSDIVLQIGNAVPVKTAMRLSQSLLKKAA